MDKKNIDDLFRERLESLLETPDERVWTAIENTLDKKRKTRVIPIWWRWSGAAAVLAIAIFAFFMLSPASDETPITDSDNSTTEDAVRDGLDTDGKEERMDALRVPEGNENTVVASPEDEREKNSGKYSISNNPGVPARDSKISRSGDTTNSKNYYLQVAQDTKQAVATGGNETPNQITAEPDESNADDAASPEKKTDQDLGATPNSKNQLASNRANRAEEVDDTRETDASRANPLRRVPNNGDQNKLATSESDRRKSLEKSDKAIALGLPMDKDDPIKANDSVDDNKRSIFEVLEDREKVEKLTSASPSRWSAGPNVAPVYFNALGEGSPIDPGFSPNAKSGSTNLSYGLSIAYALSEKLSVRSGLHKTEYGYDTNNVGFSPTLAASSNGRLQNIERSGSLETLAANSPIANSDVTENFAPEFSTMDEFQEGRIAQRFGYLEVPLELDYALLQRQFGIHLVGGISSLFLIDNNVTLSSGALTTAIGEARNLNDINFSVNVGFGVNYRFTPNVQLNIEPIFKYQLNTFSNVSGDFRPFSIGVYSGLNFRF
ncbi:outer membrane beta-barrel protein [Pricia sp. S334]|uniref:Outer membrane beta-barrel protein n=1 Tax=Pricia mediterranea TaxID=3076079 RepID=A0ABU3L5W9_9FLAO|nr:outer membrane beta-barrel protein [Pricia sp. S334]MDT7828948.1 outer membrane beta-barrel protein [Pricia sp. S334]